MSETMRYNTVTRKSIKKTVVQDCLRTNCVGSVMDVKNETFRHLLGFAKKKSCNVLQNNIATRSKTFFSPVCSYQVYFYRWIDFLCTNLIVDSKVISNDFCTVAKSTWPLFQIISSKILNLIIRNCTWWKMKIVKVMVSYSRNRAQNN